MTTNFGSFLRWGHSKENNCRNVGAEPTEEFDARSIPSATIKKISPDENDSMKIIPKM